MKRNVGRHKLMFERGAGSWIVYIPAETRGCNGKSQRKRLNIASTTSINDMKIFSASTLKGRPWV